MNFQKKLFLRAKHFSYHKQILVQLYINLLYINYLKKFVQGDHHEKTEFTGKIEYFVQFNDFVKK